MTDASTPEGKKLWEPSRARREASRLAGYMAWLREQRGLEFEDYDQLWQWSVTDLEAFWRSIWDRFEVLGDPGAQALKRRAMPGAEWFPDARLSYAENALRRRDDGVAVVARDEAGRRTELTWAQLAERVARARAGLSRLGVSKGDRVVGFVPNSVEALVAFLAVASLGAIWSSASPEFGAKSVLDRFRQIEPTVLVAVDSYRHGGKTFSRAKEVREIRAGLPTLKKTVMIFRGERPAAEEGVTTWEELLSEHEPLAFERVDFGHPLWILYSSGTTGLPKAIVQGHGGILLEHLKALSLHCDLGADDRFFWFSTTGWMMWNFLVSGLLVGSTVVLYEGSPGFPDLGSLWRLAAEEKITFFGTSAPFLLACRRDGLVPRDEADLGPLRAVGSTGAPLPADGFGWVYQAVKEDLLLASVSGGTDVCTAFILSCPLLPVHAGEIQARGLGCKVEAFDEQGRSVVDSVGELVLTEPMPSMPLYFWNDEGNQRYLESYFDTYEGVWRHGDWVKITPRGSSVVYGRSDSTLNRGGVRMGTSELYRIVEDLPEVRDSLVVDTGTLDSEGRLILFVVLADGAALDESLIKKIRATLRESVSPRHVPDEIYAVSDVPRTLSGKKLEVPIKRILAGTPVERALNRGTLANPASVDELVELIERIG